MSNELLMLIAAHFLCNAAAEERVLPLAEALACDENFTAVKLAFAEEPDHAAYRSMTLSEQVGLNRLGYARYRAWADGNPDMVRDLKAMARAQLDAEDGDS